ncbi:MAG: hypothetical protein D6812_04520, partial [Deltaproteobacteria bacterium]
MKRMKTTVAWGKGIHPASGVRCLCGVFLLLLLAGVAWAAPFSRAEPTGALPSARGETIREHPQTPPSHPPTDDPLSPSHTETG